MDDIHLKILSFEEITEKRIGFGKYQFIVIFFLALIFVSEGIELSAITLIMPNIQIEWGYDNNMQGLFGTLLFTGMTLGFAVSGLLINYIGRKDLLEFISLFQFLIGFSTSFVNSFEVFMILRVIVGFLIGFLVSLIPTLCAEFIPMDKKERVNVIINSLFSVGQFLGAIIGYLLLDDLSNGNWRRLLIICSIPPLLLFYLTKLYFMESPMFLILKDRLSEGVDILNEIGKTNANEFLNFSEMEIKKLEIWRTNKMNDTNLNEKMNLETFESLFDKKYKKATILMMINMFCMTYVFFGIVFLLPSFLNSIRIERIIDENNSFSNNNGLINLMFTTLGESFSGILAFLLIEAKIFGRKMSLSFLYALSFFSCLMVYLLKEYNEKLMIMFITCGRLFSKMCFPIINPYIGEFYPTNLKIIGFGLISSFGRIASCIMPLISMVLFSNDIFLPFLSYSLFALIGIISTINLPINTKDKLDSEYTEHLT